MNNKRRNHMAELGREAAYAKLGKGKQHGTSRYPHRSLDCAPPTRCRCAACSLARSIRRGGILSGLNESHQPVRLTKILTTPALLKGLGLHGFKGGIAVL